MYKTYNKYKIYIYYMTTPGKLHLPEPLKVKPSIAKYLDR